MSIVSKDRLHARSEERGALGRIATTPLELMSSPRSTSRALRGAPKWPFGSFPRTRANPSSEIRRYPRSEKHRFPVFSRAELFQKLQQSIEAHILRRKCSLLQIAATSVELTVHLPFSFIRPEGLLPPTEKLTMSSIIGSSANRPSVGFPSL